MCASMHEKFRHVLSKICTFIIEWGEGGFPLCLWCLGEEKKTVTSLTNTEGKSSVKFTCSDFAGYFFMDDEK